MAQWWVVLVPLACVLGAATAQGPQGAAEAPAPEAQVDECYSSASIVGAVLGTLIVVVALEAGAYLLWRLYWRSRRGEFSDALILYESTPSPFLIPPRFQWKPRCEGILLFPIA